MASRTVTRVTRLSPSADEREIIALLMLTGQQFDEFKTFVLSNTKLHVENVYTAAKTLQRYLSLSDYVPSNKRCLAMEIALMYESQFKKLIVELGQSAVDSIGGMDDVNEQTRAKYLNRNWTEECKFMHTIFRTGSRQPIEKGTLSHLALKSAVLALSQPNHREFVLIDEQAWNNHKEEPTLSTAPIIRPPRKRHYSMVSTEEFFAKRLRTNAEKDAMRDLAEEDNSHILNDFAFEETIVPRFIHYCRAEKKDASNGERWACSRNLRNRFTRNEEPNESLIHEKCLDETVNDQSYFLAIRSSQVNKRLNQKFYREFSSIIPFENLHNLV